MTLDAYQREFKAKPLKPTLIQSLPWFLSICVEYEAYKKKILERVQNLKMICILYTSKGNFFCLATSARMPN